MKPIWIVTTLLLAVIILVLVISMVVEGRDTASGTFGQADLISCCDNCCIGGINADCPGTNMTVTDLADDLGYDVLNNGCTGIPFCKCVE